MTANRSISATVFNIQTYCIHDGPGIRVTVFVKGCPLRCEWCANPESNLRKPQLMFYKGKCTACGRCIDACPEHAISLRETDGSMKAFTNRTLCRDCGACTGVCPAEARELSGKTVTVAEAIDRILKDKLFLDASGGGMTVSGGEPLFYPDFTENLLMAAREEGLHTAIETSNFASTEIIDRIYPYVDLALCDIKHMDSEKHRKYTGVPNEQLLENIKRIYHVHHVPVWARVPVIPGRNDDDENIRATADFVRNELGTDVRVCLLPYHRLGEAKNESLGKATDLSTQPPSDAHMQKLKAIVEGFGLTVQIGG